MITTERLTSKARAYEPSFDRKADINPLEINRNLETFLGERLNVLLSKTRYKIKNNLIYGEHRDEPFIEVMRRGVLYRQKVGGEYRVDKKREEAEAEGFIKTEKVMCSKDTQVGTMMLSVSPKGGENSLYQHNFYDIFTLKEENGKRHAEARRYSSALSIEEYKAKLSPLSFMGDIIDDVDFLSKPIKIDNVFFENADQVHAYLHRNHDFMSREDFESILLACESLKQEYIRTRSPRVLDAIMNKADSKAGLVKHDFFVGGVLLRIDQEIDFYGRQSVRQVAGGCGPSSGFSKNNVTNNSVLSNPFSVSEFGTDQEWFICPMCGFEADGPVGNKCPGCGLTKEDYAEESGEMVCE